MILFLLHMLVHTLHAHEHSFLLAVEHERFFVDTAFGLEEAFALPAVTATLVFFGD